MHSNCVNLSYHLQNKINSEGFGILNLNVIDEIISLSFNVVAIHKKGLFVKIGCIKAVKNWENHHDEIKCLHVFE